MDPNNMPQADLDVADSSPEIDTTLNTDASVESSTSPVGSDGTTESNPQSADQGTTSENPSVVTVQDAIKHLTGEGLDKENTEDAKKQADPVTPKAEKLKATEAPKTDAPKPTDIADPFEGLPKDKLKAATQERINSLWSKHKEAEKRYEEVKPFVEDGKAFRGLIADHKLEPDLPYVADGQVAGAIKFQAAVNRLTQGRGTEADRSLVEKTFSVFDETRGALGLKSATPTPQPVDTTEIEKTLTDALKSMQLDPEVYVKIKEGLTALRTAKPVEEKKPVAQVPVPQQEQQREQQPSQPEEHPETNLYNHKLSQELAADGIKETDQLAHVSKLMPSVLANIAKMYPGKNPSEIYSRLSPSLQYDLIKSQHIATKTAVSAVKPTAPKPTTNKPVTATNGMGTSFNGQAATNVRSAISVLTGER